MPTALWEFTLPFSSPSQNVLRKWHWSRYCRFRDECMLHLLQQAARPRRSPGRRLRVDVVRYGRTLDYGNLVGGFKPILDALVGCGFLVDDAPAWVDDRYTQMPPIRGERGGRTRITVSELT